MKTCSETFQFEKDLKWENPAPGVNRQSIGTMHEHYHSQATYVVSGKFELTIGDKKEILSAGDGYYVAPDEWHGCVCLEAGILIDTFSPVRADFLNL